MKILNMLLRNFVRCSVLPFSIQNGTKQSLLLTTHHKLLPGRTLILSPAPNKQIPPNPTEKLDLDEWKTVISSRSQEEVGETSEGEEDSTLAATRELVKMWRLSGKPVPENISEVELKNLMEKSSKSSKKKYLKYLAIKEQLKKVDKVKKEKKKEARREELQQAKENENGQLTNRFLTSYSSKTMERAYKWRTAQSMIFGQPLVFDMAYENYMTSTEMSNTVAQLQESEGWNRKAVDPFHLHFCNLKVGGAYHKELARRYQAGWDNLLVTVTEQSHIDVFPRDKLIYLTADSPNVMKTFEHDKIYIIGSMVDKSIQTGISLAQAKRLKLTTQRLPLERYLNWGQGAKNLTLDQMIRILLVLKETGDWMEALKFVPKRKQKSFLDSSLYLNHKADTGRRTKEFVLSTSQAKVKKRFPGNTYRM